MFTHEDLIFLSERFLSHITSLTGQNPDTLRKKFAAQRKRLINRLKKAGRFVPPLAELQAACAKDIAGNGTEESPTENGAISAARQSGRPPLLRFRNV